MRSQKFIFYSLTAILAVLVFMIYFDVLYFDEVVRFRPWYVDVILHFFGGIFVGLLFLYFVGKKYFGDVSEKLFPLLFLTLGAVALVAIGWEFYEYFVNIFAVAPQDPIADTFSDFAIGLTGAALSTFLVRKK